MITIPDPTPADLKPTARGHGYIAGLDRLPAWKNPYNPLAHREQAEAWERGRLQAWPGGKMI